MKLSKNGNISKMKLLINTDYLPSNMDTSLSVFINNLIKISKIVRDSNDISFTELNNIVENLKNSHKEKF